MCVCLWGNCVGVTEGEYLPWQTELQSGLWLENLAHEEDTGVFKGITPVDAFGFSTHP